MKLILIVLVMALFFTPAVLAADVVLKSSHDEYSFPVGEEARIPFIVESSFPRTNVGDLIYTLTRKESQGGLSFTQSNTQSQSFPISPGSSQNAITLSSEEPAEYEVSLSLHFRDDGKDYSSDLPPFQVHFIDNTSYKTQSGSSASSPLTSSTREIQPNNPGQVQDPFTEMEEQMDAIRQQNQQIMQQALSSQGMQQVSQNGQQPRNPDQTLQNNQMNAQSSALQKQLAQEMAEKKQEEQGMAEQLSGDPLMNQIADNLKKAGYQQKSGTINPADNGNGSLSARFEKEDGRTIDLEGKITNGSVEKITAGSNVSMPVPDSLADDARYQKSLEELNKSGFHQNGGVQTLTRNETRIEEQYQTPDGKNATISTVIRNGTVEEVTVHKEEETPLTWYLGILLLLILTALCIYAGYRYYHTLSQNDITSEEQIPEPADIMEETQNILVRAENACSEGRMKDAYALAGQGMRYFLSHRLGSGTASTNDEIITLLVKTGNESHKVQDLLDRCMMVEFARSEGNREEFSTIIDTIRKTLDRYSEK